MTVVLSTGHAVALLDGLPAGHFHTVVTSPPYWRLRSYQTPPQTWADGWAGELGQEDTPEAYIAHLLEVFAAVRRVLRDDGTLWVNLAGCYWNDPGGQNGARSMNGEGSSTLAAGRTGRTRPPKEAALHAISAKAVRANRENGRHAKGRHPWLKPLDWVDLPGMFARAMQGAGWVWRSDVTWVKPSALPESVSGTRWERCRVKTKAGQSPARNFKPEVAAHITEHLTDVATAEWADCPGCSKCAPHGGLVLRRGNGRPTKSTERILAFCKKPGYYFDQEAVREPHARLWDEHNGGAFVTGRYDAAVVDGTERAARGDTRESRGPVLPNPAGRNLRDWWVLSPEPLTDAHYAAYPTALPERCIKAGTSEWGCCPACGAPWARVVSTSRALQPGRHVWGCGDKTTGIGPVPGVSTLHHERESATLGWRATCRCPEAPPSPCRVLDPFGGSGSTGLAANRLGRDCTLVELKPAYADLAKKRLSREPLSLFAHQRPAEALT